MVNNLSLLVIGGDKRYIEVISKLAEEGVLIYAAGFEQVPFEEKNIITEKLEKINFSTIDAILLPLSGIKENGIIESAYSVESLTLTPAMLKNTPSHCVLYTGISTPMLDKLAEQTGKKVIRILDNEDVAVKNSIPTAEGALKIAIEETDSTIHGMDILVLGMGRVGFTVCKLFDAVGAEVMAGVRKRADAARAELMGWSPIMLADLSEKVKNADVCVNTIPTMIVTDEIIARMKSSSLIIDLASHPGGTDFQFAEKKGIKAIHALGQPGITAPKTAGKIIAEALLDYLK